MRTPTVVALALALAAAQPAAADEYRSRRYKEKRRSQPAATYSVPGPSELRAPAPPRGEPHRYAPRPAWHADRVHLGASIWPFWLGWSWGWGYYPLWPRSVDAERTGYVGEPTRHVSARLEAYGAAQPHGAAGTLALSFDGAVAGFNADVTGLALTDPAGTAGGDATLTLGGFRLAWTVLSDAAVRVRLESGGSMLSVPASGRFAGTSYAETTAFGPQLGASGHVGLVGPFGIEAHARVTPMPVPILDAKVAAVIRGGPLAVSLGWRAVDVNGDGVDAPEAHFKGPEIGLQLGF